MAERISFKVAPYALYDTIEALLNTDKNEFVEVSVTKEDGDLTILATKKIINVSPDEMPQNCNACDSCKGSDDDEI